MLNLKNLFKSVYGDILVARKLVMKRAGELRKRNMSLSSSLKKAWSEAKKLVEEVVTKLQKYILKVNNQTFTVESNDQEEVINQCLEHIEEVKGKKFAYNVVNNLNNRWDGAMRVFQERGTLTFAQDVFIRPTRT
jgi:predicted small metal-binding protein